MEEIFAYLASICTIGDIINWSIKAVEESREEGDKFVNKLSEHLYGIWNDVYKYSIDNKLAITKVHTEYFEKYFASVENEKRRKKAEKCI